jgi:hypothetical protein
MSQLQNAEFMLNAVLGNDKFTKCNRAFLVRCILSGLDEVFAKLVCPKAPSVYKIENDCLEKTELNSNALEKLCKVLILANKSENVCKLLTNFGLVIRDCVKGEFVEEACEAIKVLDGGAIVECSNGVEDKNRLFCLSLILSLDVGFIISNDDPVSQDIEEDLKNTLNDLYNKILNRELITNAHLDVVQETIDGFHTAINTTSPFNCDTFISITEDCDSCDILCTSFALLSLAVSLFEIDGFDSISMNIEACVNDNLIGDDPNDPNNPEYFSFIQAYFIYLQGGDDPADPTVFSCESIQSISGSAISALQCLVDNADNPPPELLTSLNTILTNTTEYCEQNSA